VSDYTCMVLMGGPKKYNEAVDWIQLIRRSLGATLLGSVKDTDVLVKETCQHLKQWVHDASSSLMFRHCICILSAFGVMLGRGIPKLDKMR
jgi:hypothetical protein